MSIWDLFRKRPDPIVIEDELGTFVLEDPRKQRSYDGEIDWLGQEVSVTLYCDGGGSLAADAALENLRKITAKAAEWDQRLRQCAVEYAAGEDGSVEIWGDGTQSGEDGLTITTEGFLSRISLGFIYVYPNGELYFDHDLDGMFTDHGLGIHADISGGISSVGLVG